MEKKIAGSNYYFILNDEGLIVCNELNISAKTFDECLDLAKQKVKEINEEALKNKGSVAVFKDWRRIFKCTIGKSDGDYIWIVNEENERRKESKKSVFVYDQSILDELKEIDTQSEELEKKRKEIEKRLVPYFKRVI